MDNHFEGRRKWFDRMDEDVVEEGKADESDEETGRRPSDKMHGVVTQDDSDVFNNGNFDM